MNGDNQRRRREDRQDEARRTGRRMEVTEAIEVTEAAEDEGPRTEEEVRRTEKRG